jgi:hypothetical protein
MCADYNMWGVCGEAVSCVGFVICGECVWSGCDLFGVCNM